MCGFCGGTDAVDEEKLRLCCAICCANCSTYPSCDCLGCSGKAGLFCLQCEFCFKFGAKCLPCCCCGPAIECNGCSICNTQSQMCCMVVSAALPCNDEVPVAVTVLGLTMFPKCGCCVPQKDIMNR